MKKCLLLIPAAILPYEIVLMGYIFFVHFELIDTVFLGSPLLFFAAIFAMFAFAIITTCAAIAVSLIKNWDCIFLSRAAMIIKLLHIPAYIFIFFCGMIFSVTIFLYAFNIFLVIFDCIFIAMSGGLAASSVVLAVRQKKRKASKAVLPVLLGFIFCVDVVASIVFYIKLRKASKQSELLAVQPSA